MTDRPATDGLAAFYEALLFVAERPLTLAELAEHASVPPTQAESILETLGSELEASGRGLRLQRMRDEFQLVTAPEVGERLAGYAAREVARVTPAALEALAIIAYRQPCTRSEVDRVRGVDSDYVMRSLLHRRLITEVGRRDTPGRPILYATTFTFLERFGLTSLEELPALSSDAAGMVAASTGPDGEAIRIPDAG